MTTNHTSARPDKPCVALIGMRGSGKSSVARELARLLDADCVDTDELIAQQAGMTIADIFDKEGETGFRRRERDVVARVATQPPGVISVGGGAILDAQNVAALKSIARVVWLTAPVDVLCERVARDPASASTRPPLERDANGAVLSLEAELAKLLQQREAAYRAAADVVIDTTGRTIEEVSRAILDELDVKPC